MKCRWTGHEISNPIIIEHKTKGMISYEAKNSDIIKDMKVIDNLDRELKTFKKLGIKENYFGEELEQTSDDDTDYSDIADSFENTELKKEEEPEHPYCVF